MKEESVRTVNKVPFLGDVPVLGWFFQNRTTRNRKTELAIFLTCRILDWDSGPGSDERVEMEGEGDYNTGL